MLDDADRRAGKPIATNCPEDLRVERGVLGEPVVEIRAKAMVAIELVNQLKGDAGAEPVDKLNLMLSPQPLLRECLRFRESSIIPASAAVGAKPLFERRRLCPGATPSFRGRDAACEILVHDGGPSAGVCRRCLVGEALERSLGEPFLDVAPAVDNSPPTQSYEGRSFALRSPSLSGARRD